MVALAAIHDDAGLTGTQLHVYFNNKNRNLGLQFRNEGGQKEAQLNTFDSNDDAHPGFIINPSYLAGTKFNNQELIFGVTEKKSFAINQDCKCPPDTHDVDISLVSPVYKVVANARSDNYRIAACSSDDNTWIYYIKKNEAEGALNIYEAVIGEDSDNVYGGFSPILPGSALAAYYDPKNQTRYIIYQSKAGNKLYEYVVDGGTAAPINNAMGVKPLSTIGVAVTETTVYLYYIDQNNNLIRVSKQLGQNAGAFGGPNTVTSAKNEVAIDSQLTVSTAKNKNHIFYQAKNQGREILFTHVIDPQ